jgi:hypothetical protein
MHVLVLIGVILAGVFMYWCLCVYACIGHVNICMYWCLCMYICFCAFRHMYVLVFVGVCSYWECMSWCLYLYVY